MDSQGIGNLFAGISAAGGIVSMIFAGITWHQALGSKEAKAKADEAHKAALAMSTAAERSADAAQEKVDQAERSAKAAEEQVLQAQKLLEQMQQIVAEQQSQSQSQSEIAASLHRPVLELIKDPEDPYYILRNNTKSSIKILEVLNRIDFHRFGPPDLPETPQEVHPGKPIGLSLPRGADVTSLGLQIEVNGKEEPIYVEIPR
jgi:hypothetical protein